MTEPPLKKRKLIHDVAQLSICDIPASVLLKIFKLLDIRTIAKISSVCSTFKSITYHRYLWSNYKADNFNELVRLGDRGWSVMTLCIVTDITPDELQMLSVKNPNLYSLNISCNQLNNDNLTFISAFKKMKQLTLQNCRKIDSEGFKNLEKCKSLEKLELIICPYLKADLLRYLLNKLKQLKRASLTWCLHVKHSDLYHLKKEFPKVELFLDESDDDEYWNTSDQSCSDSEY
eukprot:TRINITY_DN3236_c0_g1_i2.p1 TRINITY_DN3236_c0_g1~~TRINITY_DN3236_c0_g1_i2.p1  ORF type:complete len:232 (+),score=13.60 TRINITY_DN3236_c0_g1_i2:153-848(+)